MELLNPEILNPYSCYQSFFYPAIPLVYRLIPILKRPHGQLAWIDVELNAVPANHLQDSALPARNWSQDTRWSIDRI